jgi:predicted ABC-type transport system involved in lysophospholipase L1 biosynthesis ATPase subunit
LRGDDWARLAPTLNATVETGNGEAVLYTGGRAARTGERAARALRYVASGRPFRVADLPMPGGEDAKLALVRALVEQGLVALAEDPKTP